MLVKYLSIAIKNKTVFQSFTHPITALPPNPLLNMKHLTNIKCLVTSQITMLILTLLYRWVYYLSYHTTFYRFYKDLQETCAFNHPTPRTKKQSSYSEKRTIFRPRGGQNNLLPEGKHMDFVFLCKGLSKQTNKQKGENPSPRWRGRGGREDYLPLMIYVTHDRASCMMMIIIIIIIMSICTATRLSGAFSALQISSIAISPDVILCGWLDSKHQLTN